MSLPFVCPPAIARQRGKEQSLYMRSNAKRRVNILCDYAKAGIPFEDHDLMALAVEEVRVAYKDQLPVGTYGNARGHFFDVSTFGELSKVQWGRPQQNLVWVSAYPLRRAVQQLPHEYQFVSGSWYQATPSPPRSLSPFHVCSAAQQPQVQPPVDLPGAQFRGFVPPLQQQQQQQQQLLGPLTPFAADEQHHWNVAPVLEKQPLFPPTADEQPLPFLAALARQPYSPLAAPQQQPAIDAEGNWSEQAISMLRQDIARMDWEKSQREAMQMSYSNAESSQYPGSAPAASA